MRAEAARELGRNDISIGTESERLVVGLPLPALCLRYLFQSTVFPLSRMTQITGEEGSCKSAFGYEMMRWHYTYGGGACFMENELKDSPELRQSILGWNPSWLARLEHTPTYCLEEWQDALTVNVDVARNMLDAPGGPGRTIPIMFFIDSIMATAPREEIEATMRAGHSSRGFALAANLIARYMRTFPHQIQSYPFSVVGTNHLKPATDFQGRPIRNIPGGKAVKFMETFEIEMAKAPNADIDTLDYGGLRVKFVTRKNSLGPSRKVIFAELLWWHGPVDGVVRQHTAWDWDTATIELLLSFQIAKGKKAIYDALMEICDLHVADKGGRRVWSRTLGVSRDSPVRYREAGALLESRPELLELMYPLLGITTRSAFQPAVDYRDALATAEQAGAQAAQDLYSRAANMPTPNAGDLDATHTEFVAEEEELPDAGGAEV